MLTILLPVIALPLSVINNRKILDRQMFHFPSSLNTNPFLGHFFVSYTYFADLVYRSYHLYISVMSIGHLRVELHHIN